MARKSFMAWATTVDPNNLEAVVKAITGLDVEGTIIPVPQGSQAVALNMFVDAKNATTDLFLSLYTSRNMTDWASFIGLDSPSVILGIMQSDVVQFVYKIPAIVNGMGRQIRLSISESDYLRVSMRGDVAGATIKVEATFFEEDK